MKRTWTSPKIEVQQFEANEYVSACYITDGGSLTIACTAGTWNPQYNAYVDSEGNWHGDPCRQNSVASYQNNSGTEYNSNGTVKSVITNLSINDGSDDGILQNGTHPASWNSTADGITYSHSGIATVTNVQENGNHS